MESADLQLQHRLQEQFSGYFSVETKLVYKVPRTQDWNSSINILNGSSYDAYMTESISRSNELWPSSISSYSNIGRQDSFAHQSANQLLLANNNEGQMPDLFPELNEIIYNPSNIKDPLILSGKHYPQCSHDLVENPSLSDFSPSGHSITELQLLAGEVCPIPQNLASLATASTCSRYKFSQVFPATNISSASDLWASFVSSSFDFQALDIISSTNHGGNSSQSSHIDNGKLSESTFVGHDVIQEVKAHSPSNRPNKMPALVSGVTRTKRKRPGNFPELKKSDKISNKNLSRSSGPPQKVKKEKLRDRVQALQKLVVPYGKTDTASVLTETIGYIQFLHDQLRTLTMPYMNSSLGVHSRTMQAGSSKEDGDDESKRDLRKRGLCLVPLSHASFFKGFTNGGILSTP